jgi:hypothetical protein
MTVNDPTLARPVLELVTIADEYCRLIESNVIDDQAGLIRTLTGFAPLLYLRGSLLTASEPEYPEANERFVTEAEWEHVFNKLRASLGKYDEFWHIDHAETSHYDPIKASISEGLADVYQDLKDFVRLYKQNSYAARENAIFSCQSLFKKRWGQRLATLLPVLHAIHYHNSSGIDSFDE